MGRRPSAVPGPQAPHVELDDVVEELCLGRGELPANEANRPSSASSEARRAAGRRETVDDVSCWHIRR